MYEHHNQIDKLQTYLEDTFLTNETFVRAEVNDYLKSNFIVDIIIGFSVILKYPGHFVDEAYSFFSNLKKLEEVYSLNSYLNYMIREVFGKMYAHLDTNKKKYIDINILKTFRKDIELRVVENRDGKKGNNKYYGIGKYELLDSINRQKPLVGKLKREFQEFKRKFGVLNNEAPKGVSVSINRDPLENANYSQFSTAQWLNSFKTYTYTNKSLDRWSQPTEYEHGRKFLDEVASKPMEYIDFIKKLIADKDVSNTYIVKALEGLRDGKIQPDILKILFVETINTRTFEKENLLYLIWVTRHFVAHKKAYPEILEFLKENAQNGDEGRDQYNDALSIGINSVRGAAVSGLVDFVYNKANFEFTYKVLESLVSNSKPTTRSAALYKLQYSIKYDKDRVLKLVLGLAKDCDAGVLKVAINPLQYLVHHNFEKLIPFFENAVKVTAASKEIGVLITVAYCNDYPKSDELLETFLMYNEPNSIIKTAFDFIKYDNKVAKALTIVHRFLEHKEKEIGQIYDRAFFHIEPNLFSKIRAFLFEYVQSSVGLWREHPFYEFLLKSSGKHHKDCIELASFYKNHHSPDITQRGLRNEPLKVIISAYNAIRDYDKTNKALEQAMDVFDDMLQNEDYRDHNAYEVLKNVDMY
jgi:hypothetical protein